MLMDYWALWGIGWAFMPRMTLGILIALKGYPTLGLTLAITGGIVDLALNSR